MVSLLHSCISFLRHPLTSHPEQCATYFNVVIIQGVFNISSDVIMLLIGIPLLIMVKVPLQKKIGVIIIFAMGIFVIVAALLTKLYSLLPALLNDSVYYVFWYMRETTVGVFVINLPALWPVLRKLFPLLTGRGSSAAGSRGNTSGMNNSKPWLSSRKRTAIASDVKDDAFEMKSKGLDDEDSELGRSGFNTSQEHIIEKGQRNGKGGNFNTSVLEINHDVTFSVEHSRALGTPEPPQSGLDGRKMGGGYETKVQTDRSRGGDYGI
jgi:hypothetical protein